MPYKEGIKTVLCNATNGILNTPIPNPLGGRGGISLETGDYLDIEKVMSKSAIRKFLPELERIEAKGYIRWEDKGSKPSNKYIPTGNFRPSPIGATVMPPTIFDEKLNALIKEEDERDKRTLPGSLHRQTQAEYDSQNISPRDDLLFKQQEAARAELVDKAKELAEKEAWLAAREEEIAKKADALKEEHESIKIESLNKNDVVNDDVEDDKTDNEDDRKSIKTFEPVKAPMINEG